MNIAELFVRLTATDSNVSSTMRGVEQSMSRVERASTSTHLSLGRLGNQFGNLAGKIAGTHPIVGNLANVMGDFALGGPVTVGVLAGLAAIAVAYDKLTESSRKAMEQSDKLIDSLLRTARIRALGVGGESKAAIEDLAKGGAAHTQRAGFLTGVAAMNPALAPIANFFADKDVQQVVKGSKAMQEAVNQLGLAIAASNDKIAADAQSAADKASSIAASAQAKRLSALEKDAAEEAQLQKQISDIKLKIILDELHKIAAFNAEFLALTEFKGMPNIQMPFEGLTDAQKDTLRELGVLTDKQDKNTSVLANAVSAAAMEGASLIVNALNVGGGGRGSGIGGALGGAIGGAALGGKLGAFGGPLGAVVGTLAGSLIGGLFDHHKKALDANTQAVDRNTAALLLGAPSGYKVDTARFDATDIKNIRYGAQRYATRGGAPVFVTP